MLLVHRAYTDSLRITPEDAHWIFDQAVFFTAADDDADDEEIAEASYSQGDGDHLYVLNVDADYISVGALVPDAQATAEIKSIWGANADAEALLDGSDEDGVEEVEDGGWHIQRLRAQVARRMGYHAVRDRDEQGTVYIVDFTGRNDELNAAWRYVGRHSEIA